MNFKRIAATALPALAFALMPSASLATTSTTVFSATVDQNCNFQAHKKDIDRAANSLCRREYMELISIGNDKTFDSDMHVHERQVYVYKP